ncbi:MAG: phosphate ABC transporter permease subunit PstC [Gammaproteobacteria bacterium]
MRPSTLFPRNADARLAWLLRAAAAVAAGLLLLVLVFLIVESWPVLRHVSPLRFLGDPSWHPAAGYYNLSPMLSGTLLASLCALGLAVPLGLAAALFSVYYALPYLARPLDRMIELMAGIPSVVYGLWGLTVLVPLIGQLRPPGASLLAASLVLALMVLPTIALTARAALAAVPTEYLRSAAALAFTPWGTIRNVALPAARPGIIAGVVLGAARAVGETMAVLMVAGNVVRHPDSLLAPIRTLTANIALEMAYATRDHRGALFVSGLALMALVLALTVLASLFSQAHHG